MLIYFIQEAKKYQKDLHKVGPLKEEAIIREVQLWQNKKIMINHQPL